MGSVQGRNFNTLWNSFILSAVFLAILTIRLARLRLKHRKDVLLLLLLSLLSQSLLVFFLCISRAQTMHLERQSLKSIILFIH